MLLSYIAVLQRNIQKLFLLFHTAKETVGSLDTLDERNEWEIQFNQTYIQPVLEVSAQIST